MASRGTLAPERSFDDGAASVAGSTRVLRRHRSLPGGRAVLGALLVATSIVGMYAAYTTTTGGPDAAYVVAARTIRAGDPLAADDLKRTPIDLPDGLQRRTFTDPAALVGATALAPLEPGELVQASQVIRKQGGARTSEFSFPIEASRIGASVQSADRVDVVATYGTGTDAYSLVIARDVQLVSVVRGRGTLGGESASVVLTVALRAGADSLALAHATRVAELSIIRTTGALPSRSEPTTYRPSAAPPSTVP
jgi:Flp pilus assembly protein CpaB